MNGVEQPTAGTLPVRSVKLEADAERSQTTLVAEERPVSLEFQGFPHVILLASPQDLDDLAIGFAITDGICLPDEILSIETRDAGAAIILNVMLAADATARFLRRRRERSSHSFSSCGVCGIRDLNDLPQAARIIPAAISKDAVRRALRDLPSHQPLNRLTGAVHAAAWARPDGALAIVREDIGRHTALDKLIGARASQEAGSPGFCVVTSRCSYEMVQKATAAGMSLLICISAPTSLAISEAKRTGLSLVALARGDSQNVYAGLDDILQSVPEPARPSV